LFAGAVPVLDASAGHGRTHESNLLLAEAARLLEEHSVHCVRWASRGVNQIVLARSPHARAAFHHGTRSLLLDCEVAEHYDAAAVATMIAHEVCHSRISVSGLRAGTRDRQLAARIERRCVREQLEVVFRIDPNHRFVEWSRELLVAEPTTLLRTEVDNRTAIARRLYRFVRSRRVPQSLARSLVRMFVGKSPADRLRRDRRA